VKELELYSCLWKGSGFTDWYRSSHEVKELEQIDTLNRRLERIRGINNLLTPKKAFGFDLNLLVYYFWGELSFV
jgi:hypothetical protein